MKNIETTIRTAEELGGVLGEYAQAVLERERLENAIEERMRQLREECRARLEELAATEKALLADMAAFATLHPEIFADGRKSLDLEHGTVGFRTGLPKVALRRGLKEEDLVRRLVEDGTEALLRYAPQLDREQVLKDFAEGGTAWRRDEAYGLKVTQSERFYAEIRREETR